VTFDRVIAIIRTLNGWRLKQTVVGCNLDLSPDDHVSTEDFILVLLAGYLKAVARAAVISIHSKVDALTPHTLVRVVYVEAIFGVNLSRFMLARPMPKSQAFGYRTSLHCHVLDLLLVLRPELKILDRVNLYNLSVVRSLLIELSGDILPQLACLIDLAYF